MKVLSFIALFFSISPNQTTEIESVNQEKPKEVIVEKEQSNSINQEAEEHECLFAKYFFN